MIEIRIEKITTDDAALFIKVKEKVYHDLDYVEKCGFLHDVQHVSNNIFE